MKMVSTLIVVGALALTAGAAIADSTSINTFGDHVLPVLVKVDAHGKVTRVSSAVELTPRYDRLLRQTVNQWVTGPAMKHGRPMSTQFVMNVGMRATARPDGAYDTGFVYLSSSPVPSGEWIWQLEQGRHLALVRTDDLNYRGSRQHATPMWRRPSFTNPSMRQPTTTAQARPAAPTNRPGR